MRSSSNLHNQWYLDNRLIPDATGNTHQPAGPGSYTVQVTNGCSSQMSDPVVVAPSKQNQTVTFTPIPDKTLGDASFTLTATASSGLPVTFSLVSGPAALSGSTVTLTGATGTVTIRASQPGNDSYNAAPVVERQFAVTSAAKSNQTITFEAIATRTFGQAPFTLTATASSGLPVNLGITTVPVGIATLAGNTVTLLGAGQVTISASQAGNEVYNPAAVVSRTFTVDKAGQTITFPAISAKTYGEAPFALTATASSGLPVTFTVMAGPAILDDATLTLTAAGQVTVKASQEGDANHHAASAEQTIAVSKTSQTIAFGTLADRTLGDAPVTLAANASSGLAVTYTVAAGPAVLAGNVLTVNAPGTVTIKATQPGNSRYSAAPEVIQSFCVLPARPVITASGATLTSNSSAGSIQWHLNGQAIAGATAATYLVTTAGSYTVSATGPCGAPAVSEAYTVTVSATEPPLASLVQLYPNPVTTSVRVVLPAGWTMKAAILSDVRGGRLAHWGNFNSHTGTLPVWQAGLAKGLYLLQIETSRGMVYKELVIE